jgi:hypothetical protein
MHELIHHSHLDGSPYPQSACPSLRTLESGHPVQSDNEPLWRKDGSFFLAECSSSPLTKAGTVTGNVITIRDVSQRHDAQSRLRVQYAVARVLAGSADLDTALARILAAIGSGCGWDFGAFWIIDEAEQVLRCITTWQGQSVAADALSEACSGGTRFRRGSGLPGRVWAKDAPFLLVDLETDTNFPRREVAIKCGIRAGFAFPVKAGSYTTGVIEFFSRHSFEMDDSLGEMLLLLGQQIGQFVQRRPLRRGFTR